MVSCRRLRTVAAGPGRSATCAPESDRRSQPLVARRVQVAACGRARSAPGRPRPCRRPSAAATQVRSMAAASSPRAGQATTSPGCRGARRRRCRCGSGRRTPSGRPGPATRTTIGLRVAARSRRTAGWPPRRAAGPRRCAGRRGTGSPGIGQQPGQPGAEAEPEDRLLVEQGVEDPGRSEASGEAAGHPVHPALDARRPRRRRSTRRSAASSSARAALIDSARVSGSPASGSLPANAACQLRRRGRAPRLGDPVVGCRGASGAIISVGGLPSRRSPRSRLGDLGRTSARDRS